MITPEYDGKPVLTEEVAKECLAVARRFLGDYAEHARLYPPGHEGPMWVVSLEGAGEWTLRMSDHKDEFPDGVFIESVAGWCLGLYPSEPWEPEPEEDPEPTSFTWVRDGRMVAGTLADWVKGWEHDYYANERNQTDILLTWGGNLHDVPVFWPVYIDRGDMTEDVRIPYLFTLVGLPDTVALSIDGRA